jgi:hypothetical protein
VGQIFSVFALLLTSHLSVIVWFCVLLSVTLRILHRLSDTPTEAATAELLGSMRFQKAEPNVPVPELASSRRLLAQGGMQCIRADCEYRRVCAR